MLDERWFVAAVEAVHRAQKALCGLSDAEGVFDIAHKTFAQIAPFDVLAYLKHGPVAGAFSLSRSSEGAHAEILDATIQSATHEGLIAEALESGKPIYSHGENLTVVFQVVSTPRNVHGMFVGFLQGVGRLPRSSARLITLVASSAATTLDHQGEIAELETDLMDAMEQRGELRERISASENGTNSSKNQFLSNMSHELRTPLNGILGMSEALLEQQLEPEHKHTVEMITKSGRHLLERINDILELSRVSESEVAAEPALIDAKNIAETCVLFVGARARRKDLDVELDYDASTSRIRADPGQVKQILVNLLSNAVKFTPEGKRLGLKVRSRMDGCVHFTVWDEGVGIDPRDHSRLFKPFEQADDAHSRQHQGSGLGLALVQRLTRLNGGRVWVESEVGQGARFTVAFPCQDAISDASAPTLAPPPVEAAGPLRVLMVIDDALDGGALRDYLSWKGFRVTVAGNQDAAVEHARNEAFDVLIYDAEPDPNGATTTCEQLAEIADPFVSIAIHASHQPVPASFDAGVSRPVNLKRIPPMVEALMLSAQAA